MFQGGLRTDLGALKQGLYGNSGIGHFWEWQRGIAARLELFEQLSAEWLALLLSVRDLRFSRISRRLSHTAKMGRGRRSAVASNQYAKRKLSSISDL